MSLSYHQRRAAFKRSQASAKRWSAEAAAVAAGLVSARQVAAAEEAERRAVVDASSPRDVGSLKPGDLVRDRTGWNRVIRVNAKSVTVPGWAGPERIPFGSIIETKAVTR